MRDIRPFFVNLQARGLIKNNPLEEYTEKLVNVADDFVTEAGIQKLMDLENLDRKNFIDVRGRLACLLAYDYCLRIGEISLLQVQDVDLTQEFVRLTLRPEVQKGQGKLEEQIWSCFRQTKEVLTIYLKLRAELKPETDFLLLSFNGKRLVVDGCREAVQKCCSSLGIVTYKGETRVKPHSLRHSHGTLNIEPLGVGWSLSELQDRLRHRNIRTTKEVYVQNNPMLRKLRHEARMNGNGGIAHSQPVSNHSPSHDFNVGEMEAVRELGELKIQWRALRSYGLKNEVVRQIGGRFFVSRTFVDELRNDWVLREKVLGLKGFGRRRFLSWVKEKGFETLMIGRAVLMKKEDLMGDLLG